MTIFDSEPGALTIFLFLCIAAYVLSSWFGPSAARPPVKKSSQSGSPSVNGAAQITAPFSKIS